MEHIHFLDPMAATSRMGHAEHELVPAAEQLAKAAVLGEKPDNALARVALGGDPIVQRALRKVITG